MSKSQSPSMSPYERVLYILIWVIRCLLIVFTLLEWQYSRWDIFFINSFAFVLTFLPSVIRRVFSISFPLGFHAIFDLALLVSVVFEKFSEGFLVQIFFGMLAGLFGFLLMYIFYYNSRVQASYFFIALFSFSFSVSLWAVWEVMRYFLINFFTINIGYLDIDYVFRGLFLTIFGAVIVSGLGYLYLKYTTGELFDRLMRSVVKRNPKLFAANETSPEELKTLIGVGESEAVEFKSTLRMNLHTNQKDRKIEQAVLKTIVAFMNTNGGTLLVGVSDKGEIVGIEEDGFRNTDKFYLHFANMIKDHIGNEFLPFIKSTLIPIETKSILKVDCRPSTKEVFMKIEKNEEFYVRNGPASIRLDGSELISYVNQRFRKGSRR